MTIGDPPERVGYCEDCGSLVMLRDVTRHQTLHAAIILLEAHVNNLMERMEDLESLRRPRPEEPEPF